MTSTIALIGKSGSGKTTITKALAKLIKKQIKLINKLLNEWNKFENWIGSQNETQFIVGWKNLCIRMNKNKNFPFSNVLFHFQSFSPILFEEYTVFSIIAFLPDSFPFSNQILFCFLHTNFEFITLKSFLQCLLLDKN